MFRHIEKFIDNIKPDIIFNEGGNPPTINDRNTSIRENGEAGFLKYLALKSNILIKNIEPIINDEISYLQKFYDNDEILLMYFYRQAIQFKREKEYKNTDLKNSVSNYLSYLKNNTSNYFHNTNNLYEYAIDLYERYFSIGFDLKSLKTKKIEPNLNGNLLNQISYKSSYYRNKHVLKAIEDSIKIYDKVFVVMGKSHAIKIESSLNKLFFNMTF